MSPFATALKVGTTACVLTLLEEGLLPANIILHDAVQATREISRDQSQRWLVRLENGGTCDAFDVQYAFLGIGPEASRGHRRGNRLAHRTLGFHARRHPQQAGGAHRRRGLDFQEMAAGRLPRGGKLSWQDPWLQSLDLEYHNINPAKGLVLRAHARQGHRRVQRPRAHRSHAQRHPPANTRARGRSAAVAHFQQANQSYVINWDSISCENQNHFPMSDPFPGLRKADPASSCSVSNGPTTWITGAGLQVGGRALAGRRWWWLGVWAAGRPCTR